MRATRLPWISSNRPRWAGDFRAGDLDALEELALELGAAKPDHQSGDGPRRVLLDPAGHAFCLTPSPVVPQEP
ncbi:VOC family protein [Streptomyces sp. NPDC087859]|uniref:VOC family protein n=1 Tax=Streptomyces sp. NPDC087859 TaxID=3365812 RepID=UPI003802C10E